MLRKGQMYLGNVSVLIHWALLMENGSLCCFWRATWEGPRIYILASLKPTTALYL